MSMKKCNNFEIDELQLQFTYHLQLQFTYHLQLQFTYHLQLQFTYHQQTYVWVIVTFSSLYFFRKLLDDWSFLPKLFSDLQVPVAPCQPPPRLNLPSLPSVVREAGTINVKLENFRRFFSAKTSIWPEKWPFFSSRRKKTPFPNKKKTSFLSIPASWFSGV